MKTKKMNPETVFEPYWPDGLETRKMYRVMCDDKGRNGGSWLRVFIADDGDVHLTMQDWEHIGKQGSLPNPIPSIRIRTLAGGGRNLRTRQGLLWLTEAIRMDNLENGISED